MPYELWLTHGNGKYKIRFPVLPSQLIMSDTMSNDSHRVNKLGEITVIQDPNLEGFSFSSFFPAKYGPYCEYVDIPDPWATVNLIKDFIRSGNPSRFIFSGYINTPVTIERFNYYERGGEVGDIYFDLTLKEYKFITVRQITEQPAPRPNPPPETKSEPKIRKHKVKSGETLWAIARKYYGKGEEWKRIWNVKENKEMLIKRDARNLKQPGHWIYPNQELIIP